MCYEPGEGYGGLRSIAGPLLCSIATDFVWKEHFVKTGPSNSKDTVDVESISIEREWSIAYAFSWDKVGAHDFNWEGSAAFSILYSDGEMLPSSEHP